MPIVWHELLVKRGEQEEILRTHKVLFLAWCHRQRQDIVLMSVTMVALWQLGRTWMLLLALLLVAWQTDASFAPVVLRGTSRSGNRLKTFFVTLRRNNSIDLNAELRMLRGKDLGWSGSSCFSFFRTHCYGYGGSKRIWVSFSPGVFRQASSSMVNMPSIKLPGTVDMMYTPPKSFHGIYSSIIILLEYYLLFPKPPWIFDKDHHQTMMPLEL